MRRGQRTFRPDNKEDRHTVLSSLSVGESQESLIIKNTNRCLTQLTLYAIDGGEPPRTGSIQVDIAVLDANDNRPEFEQSVYEVRVPESTPVGSVLVQVRARDRDAGLNGKVRYKFSRHTAHEYATLFSIRPDNGKIFLRRGLFTCTYTTHENAFLCYHLRLDEDASVSIALFLHHLYFTYIRISLFGS